MTNKFNFVILTSFVETNKNLNGKKLSGESEKLYVVYLLLHPVLLVNFYNIYVFFYK